MDLMQAVLAELTTKNLLIIAQLVVLEGLLSFDNALALAALVKGRIQDPVLQRRALTYGIWGAYFFRIVVVFIGVWLMKFEWVKAMAGGYLIYICVKELFFKRKEEEPEEVSPQSRLPGSAFFRIFRFYGKLSVFWQTIIAVELMDVMFSIDSIGVALALSDVKWILVTGAVLGILMMRLAAKFFIKIMDTFPILEPTAFVLVGLAGLNVILKLKDLPLGFTTLTIDREIPEHPFLALLVSILVGAMILNKLFPARFAKKAHH
jgi:YkoY family integral membrane protein